METITIDILDPKAKALLNDLVKLELIRIRKDTDFSDLVKRLRNKTDQAPSLEEITLEVEAVRNARYEK